MRFNIPLVLDMENRWAPLPVGFHNAPGQSLHTLLSEEEEPGSQRRSDLVAGVSPVFSLLSGGHTDKGGPLPDCQPDSQHPMPSSSAALQETTL